MIIILETVRTKQNKQRKHGDGLGALRHGVLGKLVGKDKADRGLDLTGRDGGLLVVGGQLGGLEPINRVLVSRCPIVSI